MNRSGLIEFPYRGVRVAAMLQFPDLNPADARMAELAFEFVQFLLDDDSNLTPAGNLTGTARQKFRARLDEIIAADESGGAEAAAAATETPAEAPEAP